MINVTILKKRGCFVIAFGEHLCATLIMFVMYFLIKVEITLLNNVN